MLLGPIWFVCELCCNIYSHRQFANTQYLLSLFTNAANVSILSVKLFNFAIVVLCGQQIRCCNTKCLTVIP